MTIINRKALIYWGAHFGNPRTLDADLAYIVQEHSGAPRRKVTWAEVIENRRKRQRERLDRIRQVAEWRPYKLWVAYFDQTLMGGWHAFLEDHRGGGYRIWIDRDLSWFREKAFALFPLVLPLGKPYERYWPAWEQWKVAFAESFRRRLHDRRPLGVAYIWWNRREKVEVA